MSDLHADDIRRAMSEIAFLFLSPKGCASFGLSLASPFYRPWDGSGHRSFYGFFCVVSI
jgi:hypothetical protein